MFLPENNFKFINLSIITFKYKTYTYEIACFPNKLFEYYKTPTLDFLLKHRIELLQSENIYKNISKGELCSVNELNELKKIANIDSVKENNINLYLIQWIINNGYERKNKETKDYEIEQIKMAIANILLTKITYQNKYLTIDQMIKIIKDYHIVDYKSPKKQAGEIMKQLEMIEGYERCKFKIVIENGLKYKQFDQYYFNYFVEANDDNVTYEVPSNKIPEIVNICIDLKLDYFINKYEEEEESEEIC